MAGRNRVLVLAGGDFCASMLRGFALEDVPVVCVDRGLVHALAAGLQPSVLIGDFDSAPTELLDRADIAALPRHTFRADKDASDLELALQLVAEDDAVPEEVIVAGVSGGRTDHLLFNWLLPARRPWPFGLRLVDATTEAVVVTPERPLVEIRSVGAIVSLLPLGAVQGVTTSGLQYALTGAMLSFGSTYGLSNVVTDPNTGVTVTDGVLLALMAREPETLCLDDSSSNTPES